MRLRKGFTLIELLVVIAIIAILAAILFPVFVAAKGCAQSAQCLGNLKQLSLGLQMYVESNNSYFPCADYPVAYGKGDTWGAYYLGQQVPETAPMVAYLRVYSIRAQLDPYIKSSNVWLCPLDALMLQNAVGTQANTGINTAIAINKRWTSYQYRLHARLRRIPCRCSRLSWDDKLSRESVPVTH